jgi:hypothetical protein
MALFPLGILSAAGAGGTAFSSDYELIETQILGSTQTSITFSNLNTYSSTYKHLQIRAVARSSVAVSNMGYRIRFNGGTSTDYSFHRMQGNGSAVSSYADAAATYFYITAGVQGSTATANSFGVSVIDILDAFNTSKNTTTRTLNGNNGNISLDSAGWFNTAAIDSIVMEADAGSPDFVSGSRFSLYGIKG